MSIFKTPGVIVPVICAIGATTAIFAAAGVGSQVAAPDPIPAAPRTTLPCDMNRNAVENVCPSPP